MLPLVNIIRKYGISFRCYADDTQLNISTRPDETSKLTRLHYCNALLGDCPASSINKLQIVQNAERVLTRSSKYDHISPILQSLHWLPTKFHISYKILLFAYKALNDLAPAYLTSLLSRYNQTRSLRSHNSGLLVVPRIAKSTKGGRTFSYLALEYSGIAFLITFGVQTHSLYLNLY